MKNIKKMLWILSFCLSALLVLASQLHWVGLQIAEVVGFITGGYCVWLAVVENIWNWLVWIATDVIYIGLYSYKHLMLTSLLYALFLTMCIIGYRDWKRQAGHKPAKAHIQLEGSEA